MSQSEVLSIMRDALYTSLILSAPLLAVSLVIGLAISIFQAATQVHEQTITFVPKIIAIAFILLALGGWMMTVMSEFTYRMFDAIVRFS